VPDYFRAAHETQLRKKIREAISCHVVAVLMRVKFPRFEARYDAVERRQVGPFLVNRTYVAIVIP
jgi:hypothetical protein